MITATKIFYNGIIHTMDNSNTIATHIAIKDNIILAIGSNQIMDLADTKTELINLKGKIMFPGFYDGHSHLMRSGQNSLYFLDLSAYPLGSLRTLNNAKEKIIQYANTKKTGEWIVCGAFDETALQEKRYFTLQELDEICPSQPLIIRHISGHVLLANSLAYKLAGITKDTVNPTGGIYQKDKNGNLNGVIEEAIAMEPLLAAALIMDEEKWIKSVEYASNQYIAKGITTAQDGNVSRDMWNSFMQAHKQKRLKCRVQLLPRFPLGNIDFDSFETTQSGTQLTEDGYISLGAVKLIQDGSIQAYTASLSKPYHTIINPNLPQDNTWKGYPTRSRDELIQLVSKFHKKGWQIAIHGNGDEAIEDIICAFEAAQKEFPRTDPRHIIIHCQTVRDDQLQRMKQLGIIPSFFVVHTYFWGDRHYNIFLGPDRAKRINPLSSALKYDIPFTLHNDTYVTPIDPLFSVWSAVNRKTASGKILGENQKISVLNAMKAITIWGAYQFFEEKIKGSLEVGKWADMTILAQDPFNIPTDEIKDIKIEATVINGNIVYGTL